LTSTIYCSTLDIRKLLGFTVDEVDDSKLEYYATLATNMIIEDLTIPIIDEELDGSINGINTTFSTEHYPIADVTGDKKVLSDDITVYTWTDKDDPSTKTSVSISTIHPREGKIVLSSAPTTSIEKVTCDYHYTLQEEINWKLVKLACVYLTGFLYAIREYGFIPESYNIGALRFKHVQQWKNYLNTYYHIMGLIKKKIVSKKDTEEMTVVREVME